MESINEAPVTGMEESTSSTSRLLEMMTIEATYGDPTENSLMDTCAVSGSLTMSNTAEINTTAATVTGGNNDSRERQNLGSRENLKFKPALPIPPTGSNLKSNTNNMTMMRTRNQPYQHVKKQFTAPDSLPPSSDYRKKDNMPSSTPFFTPARNDDTSSHQHHYHHASPLVVSPLTTDNAGHPSPSPPSATEMAAESPTSVMGMTTISGITPIEKDDEDEEEQAVSPSSSHIENFMEQQHRRHQLRHRLLETNGGRKTNDNHNQQLLDNISHHNDVAPQDLLGRLQKQSSSSNFSGSTGNFPKHNDNEGLISRRLQEIESKKVVLHQKRISLEQRLYEFVDSEKRMRVMISSPSAASLNMTSTSHSPGINVSTLRSPIIIPHSNSPLKPLPPVYNNGDEMVQSYPWTDPRTKQVAYRYSGPLNKMKQPQGWGAMHFMDGQVYEGQIYAGYRWGMGTNRWPDGQVYVGEWDDHSRNGRGTHTWRDGRRVNGQWLGGHLNGRVIFSWPNGACFDGECRMGKKHGRGTHTWADGKLYNGNFVNGKEEGFGSLTQGDWKYRGQFKAGKREGYGMQIWRNKTYDGEWKNNKAHGKGRIVWQNGSTYTGEFRNGKYHGLGVYLWPNGKKYVGSWEDGCKHGQGIYTWPSSKKYDGSYEKGVKSGYGRMTWPDGRMYCGSWKNGKREGRGIQTKADGSMDHCGLWKNDRPQIKSEGGSPSNSICANSFTSAAGVLSLSNSVNLRPQFGEQNTSEEDIVIMEAQTVAVADESLRSPSSGAVRRGSAVIREPQDLPAHSRSLARSPPDVKTIPATPSKMDDVSSIGSGNDASPPAKFIVTPCERISL
ncbi:whole genome shotgun sequence [Seminavis robusta]|uniref:Whole genome shotgun sequence n=1 Tax=Seminavis robusta TaxID=568900 RepID=A0A9N8HDT7_9STRA|nr:whole genome shotgun sequence [Seminavis robusta]|eukprot:Sro357_g125570.1 whole genome shotgun sequence (838) ;mRNA; r:18313-20982